MDFHTTKAEANRDVKGKCCCYFPNISVDQPNKSGDKRYVPNQGTRTDRKKSKTKHTHILYEQQMTEICVLKVKLEMHLELLTIVLLTSFVGT